MDPERYAETAFGRPVSSLRLLRLLEDLEILVEAPSGLRGQHRWRAPAILDVLASDMPG